MLTNNEKLILNKFKNLKIPLIYKLDNTDNILYIEHVDFDLCTLLLKDENVSRNYVQKEIKEFAMFLSQLEVLHYNDVDKEYLNLLIDVVNIFIKNNL